jgi:xylulose-5-phosphate/fructose-6-phosphate phosphoketolase
MTYRRTNHANIHVRGYRERGNINTPLELAIQNRIDRFSLAIDVIDRVPHLQRVGIHAKERLRNQQIACLKYAHEFGADPPEIDGWMAPLTKESK